MTVKELYDWAVSQGREHDMLAFSFENSNPINEPVNDNGDYMYDSYEAMAVSSEVDEVSTRYYYKHGKSVPAIWIKCSNGAIYFY